MFSAKRTSSELFNINARDWLEILWKLIVGSVLKSPKIFLHLWLSSAVFRNLWQSSEAVCKSSEIQVLWRRKISRILLKKSWQVYGTMRIEHRINITGTEQFDFTESISKKTIMRSIYSVLYEHGYIYVLYFTSCTNTGLF